MLNFASRRLDICLVNAMRDRTHKQHTLQKKHHSKLYINRYIFISRKILKSSLSFIFYDNAIFVKFD